MKLLSIVGQENKIDRFISKYILTSGMQLEDALKVYEKGWKLSYFNYDSSATETLKICSEIIDKLNIAYNKKFIKVELEDTVEEIRDKLNNVKNKIEEVENKKNEIIQKCAEMENLSYPVEHLSGLDIDLNDLYNLRYMKFRYGKMPKRYYDQIEDKKDNMDAIILKIGEENDDVWVMYFTTEEYSTKIDSYFNVMKFERIWIPGQSGTNPKEFLQNMKNYKEDSKNKLNRIEREMQSLKSQYETFLIFWYRELQTYEKVNNVKRYLAHDKNGYFYMIGWIPMDEAKKMTAQLNAEVRNRIYSKKS